MQEKSMPPLRHRQVTRSLTLTFLTGRELPLRHWQVKKSCPVLHLPRHGVSGMKQIVLSVRLKGRHRRGSAPMFINSFLSALCISHFPGVR